jgi:hypothetical protein
LLLSIATRHSCGERHRLLLRCLLVSGLWLGIGILLCLLGRRLLLLLLLLLSLKLTALLTLLLLTLLGCPLLLLEYLLAPLRNLGLQHLAEVEELLPRIEVFRRAGGVGVVGVPQLLEASLVLGLLIFRKEAKVPHLLGSVEWDLGPGALRSQLCRLGLWSALGLLGLLPRAALVHRGGSWPCGSSWGRTATGCRRHMQRVRLIRGTKNVSGGRKDAQQQ